MPPATFDIAAALRRLAQLFWTQFAALVLLGLAFLTVPSMLCHWLFGVVPEGEAGTLVETVLALLGMIFVAAANAGVLVTGGRGDAPAAFIRGGLAVARPGVIVALLIAATVMLAVIARLLLRLSGTASAVLGPLLFALLFFFLVAAFVAIPAAIVERRLPTQALARSFALTRGNRWRIAGFAALLGLGLLPAMMLVNLVVFGPSATPEGAQGVMRDMTLASPGLWIGELFWLLLSAFLAPAPAVAYLQLVGRKSA